MPSIAIHQRGLDELVRYLDKASSAKGVKAELANAVERAARVVERNVKEQQLRGLALHVRSGALRRSVRTSINKSVPEAAVGTNMKYAAILELGGTIRPTHAKVLTIPLDAAKTAAGRSRGGPREVGALYDATFWRKGPSGNPILYGKRGDRLTPLFVGVSRVTMPSFAPFQKASKATGGEVRFHLEQAARIITEGR